MENKFKQIVRLYNEACVSVVSSPQKWEAFLRWACRKYKFRFDEQLLVFIQKPEATAVLEIEKWNRMFGGQVKRGVKGNAVNEDYDNKKQRVKYYLDISDTVETQNSRPVPVWEMKSEYETEVIQTLRDTFGTSGDNSSFVSEVLSAVSSIARTPNLPLVGI